jgi:hypothetical protein
MHTDIHIIYRKQCMKAACVYFCEYIYHIRTYIHTEIRVIYRKQCMKAACVYLCVYMNTYIHT